MDLYLFSLLLGFVGLAVMAFSGVAGHGGHVGHGGHHAGALGSHSAGAHAGGHPALGHGHAPAHGNAPANPSGGHAHASGSGRDVGSWFLSFLSPRVLFGVLIGFGAAGMLLHPLLGGSLLAAAAVAGGLGFELVALRPVWNLLFRFGSDPALTLESAVTDVATAVTGFNRDGEGVVKIELDGQIVQVLGRLSPADRELGVRVRAGDTLVVEEVDAVRNRCIVTLPAAAGTFRGA